MHAIPATLGPILWVLWAMLLAPMLQATTGQSTIGPATDPAATSLSFTHPHWWMLVACSVALGLCKAWELWNKLVIPRAAEAPVREQLLRSAWRRPRFTATGADVALLTDQVEKYCNYHPGFRSQLLAAIGGSLGALLLMALFLDPWVAIAVGVSLPAAPFLINWFAKRTRQASIASRRQRGQLAATFADAIRNIETLVLSGAANRTQQQLATAGERNRQATMRLLRHNQLVLFVAEAGFALPAISVGSAVAFVRLQQQALHPAEALAAVLACVVLTQPLQLVGAYFYIGMTGRAAAAAINAFHSQSPTASPERSSSPTAAKRTEAADSSATITATDLIIGHHRPLPLAPITAVAAPGAPLIITGPSGVGKTTLLDTFTGILPPHAGTLTAPTKVANTQQRTWLFSGTIRSNLKLSRPTDIPDTELFDALRTVGLEHWANERGLETPVGEQSQAISGGQAQRLAIARALLSRRSVIIADEPTAHVDPPTHEHLMQLFEQISRTHTLVLVTHHPDISLTGATHLQLLEQQPPHSGQDSEHPHEHN